MSALLAAIPLMVLVVAMAVLRWPAARAGGVALIVALAISMAAFDPSAGTDSAVVGLAGTLTEALFSTATILWIILPALMLFEFRNRTGAIVEIRNALSGLTTNRRLQAILIAWFFGLFIEGAAGFGTPVALGAPLLAGLGYPPVRAVVLALLGHAAGVSFGAVGTPTLVQVELSGLDPRALASTVAGLHASVGLILLLAMVRIAGDGPLSRSDIGWSVIAAVCFFTPFFAIATLAGPEVPSLGGALVGLSVFVLALRLRSDAPAPKVTGLFADFGPYLAILLLVLATRLIGPVTDAALALSLDWTMADGRFSGAFQPFYHPGTLLFAGLVLSAVLTRRTAMLSSSLLAAIGRLLPVALALGVMIVLSRLMVQSGMIDELASAAALVGRAWPLVAPFVGMLGTFLSGSATTSNILFTDLQMVTASSLSLTPVTMVAAQGFGSAIGNVVAPHNIIAGCATVGLSGLEGEILRQTFVPALVYTVAGGILIYFLAIPG
jgi:lactate permease